MRYQSVIFFMFALSGIVMLFVIRKFYIAYKKQYGIAFTEHYPDLKLFPLPFIVIALGSELLLFVFRLW